MKKTLLISALAFSVIANAQNKKKDFAKNHNVVQSTIGVVKQLNTTQATVWSDDFSSAATWTTSSAAGPDLWAIGTATPAGTFPLTPINSTTKVNGFALFDSDLKCSGNQIANLTNVTAINCTGHPFVNLEFQQQYRRFSDSTFVLVSNNGTTWTKFAVNKDLENNDATPSNPEVVTLNISSVAGNQATVWVRFQFYSPASLGASAGCAYAWMVDDVNIKDMPTNDMKLNNVFADFGNQIGGVYPRIPKTQVLPLTFGSALTNNGAMAQTNVKFNVSISNGSTNVYNQTSTVVATSAYQSSDTLFIDTPAFTPSATQSLTYAVTYSVSQTETELAPELVNNSKTKSFIVTDTVFARDNGVLADGISPSYFIDGNVDAAEISTLYEISNNAMASSISFFVHSSSTIGTSAIVKIHRLSPSGEITELATSSSVYAITAASSTNKWVTLPISLFLDKDSTYLASVMQTNITATNSAVVIGTDASNFQRLFTSWVFRPAATNPWVTISGFPEAVMIRLNIKAGNVGVEELASKGFSLEQNAPNPFSTSSSVAYELAKNARNVTFTVVDVTGRVVAAEKVANTIGKHNVSLSKYAAGVYYYTLDVDGVSTTKKMIAE